MQGNVSKYSNVLCILELFSKTVVKLPLKWLADRKRKKVSKYKSKDLF